LGDGWKSLEKEKIVVPEPGQIEPIPLNFSGGGHTAAAPARRPAE
jgi:hypothetical protein